MATAARTFVLAAGGKATIEKDPNAVLDYTEDWSAWLAENAPDDTIASVDVEVDGVTLEDTTFDDTSVTVWLSGGTVGERGSARIRITTAGVGAQPRTDDWTLYFKIKER